MNYELEIMAPVGSPECLAAAIRAGADSIYFGIENLNMRAHSASTFSIDDLKRIAEEDVNLVITTDHGSVKINNPVKVKGDKAPKKTNQFLLL